MSTPFQFQMRRPEPPQPKRGYFGQLYHSWFGTAESKALHTTLLTNVALFAGTVFTIAMFGDLVGEAAMGADNPMTQPAAPQQGQATL